MISGNKKIYLISLIIILIIFTVFISSVEAAGCNENQGESYFFSSFNPLLSFVEKTIKEFGYDVALAADPSFCGSSSTGCSGGSPYVTISWTAAPDQIVGQIPGYPYFPCPGSGQTIYSCYYLLTVGGNSYVIGNTPAQQQGWTPPGTSYTVYGLSNNTNYGWYVLAYYSYPPYRCDNGSSFDLRSCGMTNWPHGDFITGICQYALTVTKTGSGSGTVTSNPSGINCGSTCSANYGSGTVVTLSASVGSGTTFVGWSGEGCSGTGTCQVTMTQTRNVTAIFNQAPSATDLQAAQPDYCLVSSPSAIFSWTFTDPDPGDTQSAYQVLVDNNSNFSSPEVDSGKVISSSHSYATQAGAISWNTAYYWELKVWDSHDASSSWIVGPSFATPLHAYPGIDFSWAPLNPAVNESVQFTDLSTVYGGSSKSAWYWMFQDGSPGYSTAQNPTSKFTSSGSKSITLKVTDSDGFYCTGQKTLVGQLILPEWKEIPPF